MASDGGRSPAPGPVPLGVLLRAWRRRGHLTQDQLADHTGLGVRTIRRLESGDIRHPRNESIRLLADALQLTAGERAQLAAAVQDAPVTRTSVPGIPRQLPADVAGFTGRTRHLRDLDALLAGGTPTTTVISAIVGTAGVGKTALAVHWAHRVADRFPDGQLYVNLRGFDPTGPPTDPAAALRGFLDALGEPPQRVPPDVDTQSALYRSLLAVRRTLVVLDNARDAEQVRPLLPGAAGCLVLVTSRDQLTGLVATEGAHLLSLDLLSVAECHELLVRRLGASRVTAEPQAAGEISTACARLPLALAIAAARAAARPDLALADLAAELHDSRGRLDTFDTGDPVSDLRAVFSWSYHRLGSAAGRLFRLLCLHPGPDIGVPAAASLAGIPTSRARPLLAELTRAHLVIEHTPGRYTFHDLLRAYATELAHTTDSGDQRHAAIHRMLDHYLHTAHAAALLLYPQRDPISLTRIHPGASPDTIRDEAQATRWFTTEYRVLLSAVRDAAGAGFDTHIWQLAWALITFFSRQGYWRDWITTYRSALDAARRLADCSAQAHAHQGLGTASAWLGRHADAETHLRQALSLYQQVDDGIGQAHTHHTLALVLQGQDRHSDALSHAVRALALHRAAGHQVGQANALSNIGWLFAQLGDHLRAISFCRQALALHLKTGDERGQAATLDSIGTAHLRLGQDEQGIASFRRAHKLYRNIGDRWGAADVLIHLGDAHHAVGDNDAAVDTWQEALDILDDLEHPDAHQLRLKLGDAGVAPGPALPRTPEVV